MERRILLNEIPSKEFHSAIFTTYSVNLYYLEQQVLPLFRSKEIHYISVLADSNMLSQQLETMSLCCQKRQRTYAVNGILCKGAFHPKLIFLAGDNSLLLLIGSGNLTSSGHGKNLEVWNAVFVNETDDSKLGFVIEAWNYMKFLHTSLGVGADNKIKAIKENCTLLKKENVNRKDQYSLNDDTFISFLHTKMGVSLFNQLKSRIGNHRISQITIMSPFYDAEGNFTKLLNDTFEPKQINVILQKEFGNVPIKMHQTENVFFYDWENVRNKEPQKFFHAKNIIFSGSRNFLFSGSANASIAAFGWENKVGQNEEAGILYQSEKINYLKQLGLNLKVKKTNLQLYNNRTIVVDQTQNAADQQLFIQSAEKNYNQLTITINSKSDFRGEVILSVVVTDGQLKIDRKINIQYEITKFSVDLKQNSNVLFCYFSLNGLLISNKQFVTDIVAFETTNPSPKNRTLNQLRKTIEDSGFSTLKIIDYLSTMCQSSCSGTSLNVMAEKAERNDVIVEVESSLLYIPYDQIRDKIKHFDNSKKGKTYVEYQSVRLWDYVLSYINNNKEKGIQAQIDEEESEDVNNSSGREDHVAGINKISVPRYIYENKKNKIEGFLQNYINTLVGNIKSKEESISIVDLSMYLIMLEVLLQHTNCIEKLLENDEELFLINPKLSNSGSSWSGYVLKIVGLFNLWWNQTEIIKENESQEYNDKFEHFKQDAFCMTMLAMSLFTHLNRNHNAINKIQIWTNIELLNCMHSFIGLHPFSLDLKDYLMFVDSMDEVLLNGSMSQLKKNFEFLSYFIGNPKYDSKYYFNKGSGFSFVIPFSYESIGNRILLDSKINSLF